MSWFSEIFPTTGTFVIFVSYMFLFVNQGILITASKSEDGTYLYNPVTVVLFTELTKLFVSAFIYLNEGNTVGALLHTIKENTRLFKLYFIPAGLYAVYNILAFYNLANFDPTTYFLLLQLRVVVTGVVFQVLFSKTLSRTQWGSLGVLTLGCVLSRLDFTDLSSVNVQWSFGLVLLAIQVFCSCFAGVYNEYLLKGRSGDLHVMVQNIFMYANSILINLLVLTFDSSKGGIAAAFSYESLQGIMRPIVLGIIINNTCVGIVTSLFLKRLNSILKAYASAIELLVTAFTTWLIFSIPLTPQTFVALLLVSGSIYMYTMEPIKNSPPSKPTA